MLSFTVGKGLKRPLGKRVELGNGSSSPRGVVLALRAMGNGVEEWWSPFTWKDSYRSARAWESAAGISVDVDFSGEDMTAEDVAALGACRLPGSAWHPTPKGARVIFVFGSDCSDSDLVRAAARGAGALVSAAIAGTRYKVDEPVLEDLGRLFFAPKAHAKGVQRSAEVFELSADPYKPEELAAHAPKIQAVPPKPLIRTPRGRSPAECWNADHPLSLPKSAGDCPMCGHKDCFGQLADEDQRWFCWSTDHPDGVGVRSGRGYHGDALDLEAFQRGCKPVDVLREEGYIVERSVTAKVTPIESKRRPLRNGSYLTVYQILANDERGVLEGRALRTNRMTGRVELDGKPLRDEDTFRIRGRIELLHSGGVNKFGDEVGMKQTLSDVQNACSQVAAENGYHPVEDYLNGLKWDGVSRLEHIVEDILGAQRNPLNIALVKRFFVSAVARALDPGCKVDTVLILLGKQGCGKSTFFRELGSPWFVESAVDIHDKDAMQVLRNAWVFEWAELEVLRRAKDATAAKAFISCQVDTYRQSFGRFVVDVPRSAVIVGTTNNEEFLVDDTGNRRFWPLRVGAIDLSALKDQREQLWAEAAELYHLGEQWWLTEQEETELETVHKKHLAADPWADVIEHWCESQVAPFVAASVLENAIEKPRGQWSAGDMKRVVRVLKELGYRPDPNKPRGQGRLWHFDTDSKSTGTRGLYGDK